MSATATVGEARTREQLAPRHRVLLHKDERAPVGYVAYVLQEVFKFDEQAAETLYREAKFLGVALVAVLPVEVAELRYEQTRSIALTAKLPCPFSVEPEW